MELHWDFKELGLFILKNSYLLCRSKVDSEYFISLFKDLIDELSIPDRKMLIRALRTNVPIFVESEQVVKSMFNQIQDRLYKATMNSTNEFVT